MLNLTDLASTATIASLFVALVALVAAVLPYWLSRKPLVEAKASRSVLPLPGKPDIQIRFLNRGARPITVTHVGFSVLGQEYSAFQEVAELRQELTDGRYCTCQVSSTWFADSLLRMMENEKAKIPKRDSAWRVEGVFIISVADDKHFKIKLDPSASKALILALKLRAKQCP